MLDKTAAIDGILQHHFFAILDLVASTERADSQVEQHTRWLKQDRREDSSCATAAERHAVGRPTAFIAERVSIQLQRRSKSITATKVVEQASYFFFFFFDFDKYKL